jgi:hypothetical protein
MSANPRSSLRRPFSGIAAESAVTVIDLLPGDSIYTPRGERDGHGVAPTTS